MENEAQCDADCLLEAEAIKKDAVRLAAAQKVLEGKSEDISSIQDLKDKAAEMDTEDQADAEDPNEESDLTTEEDKAALQYNNKINGKLKDMGMHAAE